MDDVLIYCGSLKKSPERACFEGKEEVRRSRFQDGHDDSSGEWVGARPFQQNFPTAPAILIHPFLLGNLFRRSRSVPEHTLYKLEGDRRA
jgi:hypothetical protein